MGETRAVKPLCLAVLHSPPEGIGLPWSTVEEPVEQYLEPLMRECQYILLVGSGAWKKCPRIADYMESRGYNPLRISCLDDEVEPLLSGLSPKALIVARASAKTLTRSIDAPYRLETGKKITRRILLSRGPLGLRVYIPGPRLSSPTACASLKNCSVCVESCPVEALKGKPPVLDPEKCTGCGYCLSTCPLRVLESTGTSSSEIYFLLRSILARLRGRRVIVVFTCFYSTGEALEALLEEYKSLQANIIPVPVWCPGEATGDIVLSLIASGAGVVVHCSAEPLSRCKGYEYYLERILSPLKHTGLVAWTTTQSSLRKAVQAIATTIKGVEPDTLNQPASIRSIKSSHIFTGSEPIPTSIPVPATITVQGDICDLCGACTAECPTNALLIRNQGDKQLLVYRPAKCIGCRICEKICPHRALEAKLLLPPPSEETVLAEDEIARCIVCGKPIGSKKLIDRVVRVMREKGFPEETIITVYMCNECKVKYRLGLVEPRMEREKEH